MVDPLFHEDSYGYRPGKSARQALAQTRKRCWKYAWVVEIDIKGFFDNIDWELLLRAVRRHISERWVVMYIERWLKAPVQMPDGEVQLRTRGTPQGGVVSPILANLFLHYAFDKWMQRHHEDIPFERYADDAVCHCHSLARARMLVDQLRDRFAQCGLELHPQKTRVVYCKDGTDGATTLTRALTFLALHSGLDYRRIAMAKPLSISVLQSAPRLRSRFVRKYEAGTCNCAVTRLWTTWRACSMRRSEDGSTTMVPSTRSGAISDPTTDRSQAGTVGRPGNSNGCVGTVVGRAIGSNGLHASTRGSLRTGHCCRYKLRWEEPDERRRSRPVP